MLASSRRSKQKFRGRGHAGAHNLIPMPAKCRARKTKNPRICIRGYENLLYCLVPNA